MHIKSILTSDHLFLSNEESQNPPIYQSSSYRFANLQEGIDVFSGKQEGYVYARYGHPNLTLLENKLGALEAHSIEHPKSCLITSSGMSAIKAILQYLSSPGDHIFAAHDLYGGTSDLLNRVLKKWDIQTNYLNFNDLESLNKAILKQRPSLIYLESPSNPLLHCYDIKAIADICNQNEIPLVVDNTFNTPLVQRPLELGADYVIYSTTKYLNGHGTALGGAICFNQNPAKYQTLQEQIRLDGATLAPFDAWLLNEGLKTLDLRIAKQHKNTQRIFQFLTSIPKIGKIYYPGNAEGSSFTTAKSQMTSFGAMISFEVPDPRTFCDRLKLISRAPTLGDLSSLVLHPASMSHRNLSQEQRNTLGISDQLIRMSVGIEYIEDLKNDILQALE